MDDEELSDAKQVLATLVEPLARLMISSGITLQEGVELLKIALVESAAKEHPDASASHVSLLTGVHRKDIKRLEGNEPRPEKSTAAARVLSLWKNDSDFSENGDPKPLARSGEHGFDALVERAKVDAAPATVLSILMKSGNVEERDNLFHWKAQSLIPEDRAEKLRVAAATLKPHLNTTISNVLGDAPQFDQALRYSHLTQSAARSLEKKASALALEMLQTLAKDAHKLQQEEEGDTLFVAGSFTHITEHEK